MKRLILADDHLMMLEAIAGLLSGEFEIAGTALDGRELLRQTASLYPDAVVLDIAMPGLNGIEAARKIHRKWPWIKLVFLSQHLDPAFLQAAFSAGASAYVAKRSAGEELVRAIRTVLRGSYYVTPLAGHAAAQLAQINPRINPASFLGGSLTPRQREVLQLLAEGKSSKEIAEALEISPKTVEFHRKSLSEQVGARGVAELTRYALLRGIVS